MGSEMCIRDRLRIVGLIPPTAKDQPHRRARERVALAQLVLDVACLLYTSDAADELPCVDLGGRRIIKIKNKLSYI